MFKIAESILATSKQCDEFSFFVKKQMKIVHGSFGPSLCLRIAWHIIGLFLSIRCRNWNLLVSSLKLMAPLFGAQCLESRQANGQAMGLGRVYRVKWGCYFLPLDLELPLPCHSRDTGYCTNAHA